MRPGAVKRRDPEARLPQDEALAERFQYLAVREPESADIDDGFPQVEGRRFGRVVGRHRDRAGRVHDELPDDGDVDRVGLAGDAFEGEPHEAVDASGGRDSGDAAQGDDFEIERGLSGAQVELILAAVGQVVDILDVVADRRSRGAQRLQPREHADHVVVGVDVGHVVVGGEVEFDGDLRAGDEPCVPVFKRVVEGAAVGLALRRDGAEPRGDVGAAGVAVFGVARSS